MTLIEAVRNTIWQLHYSPRTEEAYVHWIRQLAAYHHRRHPREMAGAEITAWLDHLAVQRQVSASTRNQALCAIVFLFGHVLGIDLSELDGLERAKRPEQLPVVLSRAEVRAVLDWLNWPFALIANSLYGSGLRLNEVLSLRVKGDPGRADYNCADGHHAAIYLGNDCFCLSGDNDARGAHFPAAAFCQAS